MNSNRSLILSKAVLAALLPTLTLAAAAQADVMLSTFTPGDLVVLRGGDSTTADGSASTGEVNTYLDEYTTTGTYVGTLPVGTNLTLPAFGSTPSHEGGLDLSQNGQFLTLGGYTTAVGSAARPTNGTATETIAEVGNSASTLNTSTTITPSQGTGQYIHAVASTNGQQFYVAGKYPSSVSASTPASGLDYIPSVGGSPTNLENVDWRNLELVNGTLYGGTGSSSVGTHGAYQIGTTASPPTSGTPTNTLLTNYNSGTANAASDLALLNVPTTDAAAGNYNGLNVLYTIGDDPAANSITKYYYNASTGFWVNAGNAITFTSSTNELDDIGLTATVDPTNPSYVDLYVSGEQGVFKYVDTSGDPETALTAGGFTSLITPSTGEGFYGVALAPSPAPEPTSLALIGLCGLALLRRRR